jgi:hypothetical protein
VRRWFALGQMLFTSTRIDKGDLHMGYNDVDGRQLERQATDIVNKDAKDNCEETAKARAKFNELVKRSNMNDSSREVEGDIAAAAGDKQGDKQCAAADREIAGAIYTTDENFFSSRVFNKAEEVYDKAGKNRMDAGDAAAAAKNHAEAARNYGKAHDDYKQAGDMAKSQSSKKGDVWDVEAQRYYKKAAHADEAAKQQLAAGKAAEDGDNLMKAGKKQEAAKNHGEAAKNYRGAQGNYNVVGDDYDRKAKEYHKKAEEAGKAAEKEEAAGKPKAGKPGADAPAADNKPKK